MMWPCLSRRESVLLGLLHVVSLLAVSSTTLERSRGWMPRVRRSVTAEPTSKDRGRAGPTAAEVASESCRCAADQWEGVLRSVDREIYVGGQTDDSDRQRLRAAELETNTVVHYDFRNGLFASVDTDSGVKTAIDYNTGIQYVVASGKCRLRPAAQVMTQMCLPENAQLDGKFLMTSDESVALWKVVGPQNATLRATVSLENCLPVSEETFSLDSDYALVTSSSYVNVQMGIQDRRVFDVPSECRHAGNPFHRVRSATRQHFSL